MLKSIIVIIIVIIVIVIIVIVIVIIVIVIIIYYFYFKIVVVELLTVVHKGISNLFNLFEKATKEDFDLELKITFDFVIFF